MIPWSPLYAGGTHFDKIVSIFNDCSNFEDYFKFSKFVIAIIETFLAAGALSLTIMLTS